MAQSEIPAYEGAQLECPAQVPADLIEGAPIAIYFNDLNKWEEGIMTMVDKRKRKVDNISVMFPDGIWNFCVGRVNHGSLWGCLLLMKTRMRQLND